MIVEADAQVMNSKQPKYMSVVTCPEVIWKKALPNGHNYEYELLKICFKDVLHESLRFLIIPIGECIGTPRYKV